MKAVVKVWAQGQAKSSCIVIPKEIAKELKIKPGDYVEVKLKDGEVRVRKIE